MSAVIPPVERLRQLGRTTLSMNSEGKCCARFDLGNGALLACSKDGWHELPHQGTVSATAQEYAIFWWDMKE